MCFNLRENAFLYADHEYFDWFRDKNIETLRAVIKWKGLHRAGYLKGENFERIWTNNHLNQNNMDGFPLVTRVFLHHLDSPEAYPILDKYVWKAMRQLQPQIPPLPQNPTHWEAHYIERYLPFFNQVYDDHEGELEGYALVEVDEDIIKRRVLDRALFEYGRQL